MTAGAHALVLRGVRKQYGGLRPLRLERLEVEAGASVALGGFDATTAEVFVNLVTGATLPEEGEVVVFGRPTSAITESQDWLGFVDRFGILSDRIVLLDMMTVAQNVAMPLTLALDPVPPDVAAAVADLGAQVGLDASALALRVDQAPPLVRHRVRLARALALNPAVLLAEHAAAALDAEAAARFAADVRRVTGARGLTTIALAADPAAAAPFADRAFRLDAATGRLRPHGGALRLVKRLLGGSS